MSNVLIGIIGVILFIGLALAGALFLGPRFQQATLDSKASAMMSAVDQSAKAASLYRLYTGNTIPGYGIANGGPAADILVGGGYLKAIPQTNEYGVGFRALNGAGVPAVSEIALNGLGDSVENRKICAAIARHSGLKLESDDGPPLADAPIGASGCFRIKTGWAELGPGFMIAYQRL